jgi:hypothetical protein
MKFSVGVMGAVVLSVAASAVAAEEQGVASSMLCAVTHTVSCDSLGDCIIGPASAVNLPVFLKFNPDQGTVESARQGGERRTSKIAHVGGAGDYMVFLGDEGDSGWSATVTKSTGSFTGTVSEEGLGYVIFGSCLAN